jgi:hypothetical protein
MAHAEQLDDGVVAAGQEQSRQVIVLALLTPGKDISRWTDVDGSTEP